MPSGCDDFGDVTIAIASNDENGAAYKVTSSFEDKLASGTAPVGTNCPKDSGSCEEF